MSNKKVNESLSESLGLDFEPENPSPITKKKTNLPVIQDQSSQVVTYVDVGSEDEQQAEEDFEASRTMMTNLLEKGDSAIDAMLEVAQNDETPRSFEVVATLIKTMSEVSTSMMDLHEKRKKLKEQIQQDQAKQSGINIDKAVFVGTTSELLKEMKERQRQIS